MPVVLDSQAEALEVNTIKGHRRGLFEELVLTEEQTGTIIYRKLESLNTELSDTYHPPEHTWVEEFTGLPQSLREAGLTSRVFTRKGDDEEVLSEDDGLIIRYHGTCAGERGRNERGTIISKKEADENQELSGDEQPMYHLWEFRIAFVVRTDGPARKERLMDSVEDQRTRSEAGLLSSIEKAFEAMASKFGGNEINSNTMPTNPQEATRMLMHQLGSMPLEERETLFQTVELQQENEEAEKNVTSVGQDLPEVLDVSQPSKGKRSKKG